jgi:hypothetical protein
MKGKYDMKKILMTAATVLVLQTQLAHAKDIFVVTGD